MSESENIGKKCTWDTGSTKGPRSGVIIAWVPGGESLSARARNHRGEPLKIFGVYDKSKPDRYVVCVDRQNAAGKPLAPDYYAPRCGAVKVET
jgi:hypothetical protein